MSGVLPAINEMRYILAMRFAIVDDNELDIENVAKIIGSTAKNSYILLKGGHLTNDCDDCLYFQEKSLWITGERINTNNTHGTGCSLSASIASNLALGYDVENAVRLAKKYIEGAIRNNPNLGKGYGPINHCWKL